MQVIPAIDLLDGKVVRLSLGAKESAVAYARNPLDLLDEFKQAGATTVHVVDLNSAFQKADNLKVIKTILQARKMNVQVGGGIRTVEKAFYLLANGAEKIIIGSIALDKNALSEFVKLFEKRVWVAVDASGGKVRTNGWVKETGLNYLDFLSSLENSGVGGVVLTDVSRDGLLQGITPEFYEKARNACNFPLIASGGISSLNDIELLKNLGFEGVVVGKAVYEKKLDLRKAIELVENAC